MFLRLYDHESWCVWKLWLPCTCYILSSFKSCTRRLEKILKLFKVKTSPKNESFLRATQTSRFRNFGVSLKKPSFLSEGFTLNSSKIFSRRRMQLLKVCSMYTEARAFTRTNSHGCKTSETFFNDTNVKKWGFSENLFEICLKNHHFWMKRSL